MRNSSLLLSALLCAALLLTGCPPASTVCGNGKVETGETCDDGNTVDTDACSNACKPNAGFCGNGVPEAGEVCDDGNTTAGDGCENDCTATGGVRCGNGFKEGTEQCDDGNQTPADGCENDCTLTGGAGCGNGTLEGNEACDDGNTTSGDGCEANCALTTTGAILGCPGMSRPAPATTACEVTAGTTAASLITGVVLGDGVTYMGGQVLVSAAGDIACVGCDCTAAPEAAGATTLVCPKAVVSPGLINAHDHISYQGAPYVGNAERYEHRHDWRVGNDGHTRINNGGNATNSQIRWAEVRQVMSGTTSIIGSTFSNTGNDGLLRNLDTTAAGQLGLGQGTTDSDTFPLNDTSGLELTQGCGYPDMPTAARIPANAAFLPHVSEGIELSAWNEFRCISAATGVLGPRTGIIHGIGLRAADVAMMAQLRTSLIWSPRSNVSLYGDTATVALFKRLGVNIALGTDWTISGSMNILRELKCADELNRTRFNTALTDEELWRTVTAGGADATASSANLGRLLVGKKGDVAVFRQRPGLLHRSVIEAAPGDVLLTMRGGKVLYGDANVVAAYDTAGRCETLDVCGVNKSVCVAGDVTVAIAGAENGLTYASLVRANAATYPLFSCTTPTNEPTCVPQRAASNSKSGSSTYTVPPAADDTDGDGVPNATDNCPGVFNPVRPMDTMAQPDHDADGVGDVCDVCPLDANTTTCTSFDPNDVDSDTIPNGTDNCPATPNTDQADFDLDGVGDVCDPCPQAPNPGGAACPATIYALKMPGSTLLGQRVALSDVLVTASGPSGFFLQVPEARWNDGGVYYSGVFAYAPGNGLVPGDLVNVASTTPVDYFGQVQLSGVQVGVDGGLTVVSQGNTLPALQVVLPDDIATPDGGLAWPLEGVLVRVDNVAVLDINPALGAGDRAPSNEFVVTGGLRVNDLNYLVTPFPAVGQQYQSITGVLEWRNGNFKLEPRGPQDFVFGPAIISALEPALSFLRVGGTATIPQPLMVRLSNPETTDVAVTVTSPSTDIDLDGGMVTVLANQTTAVVPVTGLSSTDGGVATVTAMLGASMATADIRVLAPGETGKLIALEPATSGVVAGGMLTLTVRLDLPAEADTVVTLAVTPAVFGTAPATVTVPADAMSASFTLAVDAMATGMAQVTATLGADVFTSNVTAQVSSTNHIVISELAPSGAGGAGDEFVELYNPTGAAVDISDWRIEYKSQSSVDQASNWLLKATIPSNASIRPGGYYLVASPSFPAGGVTPDFTAATNMSFSANAGHVRLVDGARLPVDKVGFGAGANVPNAPETASIQITTFGGTVSIERKASPSSTSATMSTGGTDALRGNGTDSDNNAMDFVSRAVRDPQNSSSPSEP